MVGLIVVTVTSIVSGIETVLLVEGSLQHKKFLVFPVCSVLLATHCFPLNNILVHNLLKELSTINIAYCDDDNRVK